MKTYEGPFSDEGKRLLSIIFVISLAFLPFAIHAANWVMIATCLAGIGVFVISVSYSRWIVSSFAKAKK